MFERITNDDRGQVGIGTLIVFIAMVLVAAIAAGVLINTAGFLQSSAQESGTGASEQTTNRLEVTGSVTAATDVSANEVDNITVNVKREAGAGNIDLSDATIQFVGPGNVETLTFDSGSPASGSSSGFVVSSVRDNDKSISDGDPVLNDNTDVAAISIDLDQIQKSSSSLSLQRLTTGESATMTITTDAGGETEVQVTVPDTIQDSTVTLSP